MRKLSISLGQMQIKLARVADNLREAERMIAAATDRDSAIDSPARLWSTGYDLENASDYASTLGCGLFAQVSQLAARSFDRGLRFDVRAKRRSDYELRHLL